MARYPLLSSVLKKGCVLAWPIRIKEAWAGPLNRTCSMSKKSVPSWTRGVACYCSTTAKRMTDLTSLYLMCVWVLPPRNSKESYLADCSLLENICCCSFPIFFPQVGFVRSQTYLWGQNVSMLSCKWRKLLSISPDPRLSEHWRRGGRKHVTARVMCSSFLGKPFL